MWWIVAAMIFSIPIIAIITDHMQARAKLKAEMIQDQLKLEQLKQENFLLETEKMKLELERMQIETAKDDIYKIK